MPKPIVLAVAWMTLLLSGSSLLAQQSSEPTGLQAALVIEQAMVDAIARAEKSVVAITRVRRDRRGVLSDAEPTDPSFVPDEYGTGVIIDGDGFVLTNYHVIGDPDEFKYVVWSDRKAFSVQEVLGADPWMDLAVLKIDAAGLEPITFGDTTRLRKGQLVIALGNPYAIARDGQASASWGIISNLSRKATKNPSKLEPAPGETLHHFGTLIQTDAKLNLGTSGGALINLKGQMIGLTTSLAAMDRYEKPAGFAIPVDDSFLRVLKKLKSGQKAQFGFLGVSPDNQRYADRGQEPIGVFIARVVPGTPADAAGIQVSDLITHVNDQPIMASSDLMRELGRQPAGESVRLTLFRNGRAFQTRAKLSKKYVHASRPAYSRSPDPTWRGMQIDYATAIPFLADHVIDPEGCVGILSVERDSPAWKAGLRPNTFINFVERQRVSTPQQFYEAVAGKTGDVRVSITPSPGARKLVRVVSP